MFVYHQCGHNTVWNIDSLESEQVGDGLIISPVNIDAEKITEKITSEILAKSFFDPQFYLPHVAKSSLNTYPFFPANIVDEKTTGGIGKKIDAISEQCLQFQQSLGLDYLVIPTRYYENVSSNSLQEIFTQYVEPFVSQYVKIGGAQKLLLTSIVSQVQIEDKDMRVELLSWLTAVSEITGVYLIFNNSFTSKQIVDPGYLSEVLNFIKILRENDLEVHIGYSGLEGLLYSVADPTSVSVGAYENLRSFNISRMEDTNATARSPTPRIFSDMLVQSVPVTLTPALDKLYPAWEADLIPDTPHKEFLISDPTKLHFSKGEIYKHYFCGFSRMVSNLPGSTSDRIIHIDELAKSALVKYKEMTGNGIVFNADSDGEHLVAWRNALGMYKAAGNS